MPPYLGGHSMDTHARLSLRIPAAASIPPGLRSFQPESSPSPTNIPLESSPHGRRRLLAARIPPVSMPSLWNAPSESSPCLSRGIFWESSQLPYCNGTRSHGSSVDQFSHPASDSSDETTGEFSSQIFGVYCSDCETSSSPPSPPYCRNQEDMLRDGYGEVEFSRDFGGTSSSNTVEFSGTSSPSCGEEKSEEDEEEADMGNRSTAKKWREKKKKGKKRKRRNY